jgi:hypothetical protein
MKITLRKASALQSLLRTEIANVVVSFTVDITRYDSPVEVIKRAEDAMATALTKKLDLTEARYSIRSLVNTMNASSGIDEVLTKLVAAESEMAIHSSVSTQRSFRPAPEVITRQHDDLVAEKASTERYSSRRESISVYLVEETTASAAAKKVSLLKKQTQNLSDQLLTLNTSTFIELDEKTMDVLKKYDII